MHNCFNFIKILCAIKKKRSWECGVIIFVSLVAIGTLVATQILPQDPRIIFFDVGQGDAILIETAHHQTILVDGGPSESILSQLGHALGPFRRNTDIVVLTHPHHDHLAGLNAVLRRYRVDTIVDTALAYSAGEYRTFHQQLEGRAPEKILSVVAGDRIAIDGVELKVLWPLKSLQGQAPPPEGLEGSGGVNDASVVLEMTTQGHRVLLTGDVSSEVEKELLARKSIQHVDILKVGHHGSRFSTSQGLVDAARPSIAVISVGVKNDYNHPAQSVIARLEKSGAHVYQTRNNGTVQVIFRPNSVSMKTDR